MKTRPILFSGPMVRALLDGSKSQTRRVVKPQFGFDAEPVEMGATNDRGHQISGHSGMWWDDCAGNPDDSVRCPYGQPGDRLGVRETWNGPFFDEDTEVPDDAHTPKYCQYRADGGPTPEYIDADENLVCRWRPSIFMPRWASRITLEITGVRVERLCDISEGDAYDEGAAAWASETVRNGNKYSSVIAAYQALWESINGPGSWDANPWVWVLTFGRVPA